MGKQITKSEYLQLLGLMVLAKNHNDSLKDILDAVRGITGEVDDMGHCSDAVYSDYEVKQLLEKLDIAMPGDEK